MQAAIDIPKFDLPSYQLFVRHAWRYRDDSGETAICPPPAMFSIQYDDEGEATVLRDVYRSLLTAEPQWTGRVRDEGHLVFSDLQALYAYLGRLCRLAQSGDGRAALLGEYVLWLLGFRWVWV